MDAREKERLLECEAELNTLKELLKSESVYYLLRFGVKSPSKSGMDNCADGDYMELYNISTKLRNDD